MDNRTKILGIVLIILIALFIVTVGIVILNSDTYQKKISNKKILEVETNELIRSAEATLNSSPNLEINSITDDSMIKFAIEYMSGYNTKYTEDEILVEIQPLEETVEYIFDRKINYQNVSYRYDSEYVYVPEILKNTDIQIYKFNRTEYDKQTGIYVSYIDNLVPLYDEEQFNDYNVIEYDNSIVMSTLVFKYKIIGDRKILLSYNRVDNINY